MGGGWGELSDSKPGITSGLDVGLDYAEISMDSHPIAFLQ